ncbi:putative spermidine/putrescine transporter subunit; ATP-binding component of ABC superfamily tranporter [Desulfosarcina cetonica]|uniref:ABC transporter ATP-binding protein n=1 Tax=Desulfosarcina cetonica TaxID=90730 RepID=UPI0006CFD036|nr:ABC transporter ATP-binding protein [Desulfosarcina cetonica]VTR69207.1 putative spermidine/putrescine transporter subunit; ATP-binding component of ABC superfamily tranporter [Desulfosarcina cetonica]
MAIDLNVENVSKTFGDFTAVREVSFAVEKGRFFSILGPSGCGKTTLLRMIAGFIEPTVGRIMIRGKDMAGFPPNRRPVNLIFQHLALFPMMNVAQNIAFGLQRRRETRAEIDRKVDDILARVGLPGFGGKRIDQLSGGQKQRVAIARCLVLDPAVLLLDEPLGALDLKLREQMKVELKKLQAEVGTTFIYITHDQSEALVMSDHVAVMNGGRFEQVDTPRNLYARPQTPFVARFVGENNGWKGVVADRQDGLCTLRTDDDQLFSAATHDDLPPGTPVIFFIRPEAIIIAPDAGLENFNRMTAVIQSILFDGANSRMLAMPEAGATELMIALPQNRQYDHLKVGDRVAIGWSARSAVCFKDR